MTAPRPIQTAAIPGGVWLLAAVAIGMLAGFENAVSAHGAEEWFPMKVPGPWPADVRRTVSEHGGHGWYRCWIMPHGSFFSEHERDIPAESVGIVIADLAGAHEVFVNGVAVGESQPSSAEQPSVEGTVRHKVPKGVLQQGKWNEVVIHVRLPETADAGGFLGESPFLMGYFHECVLEGTWQFRVGEAAPLGSAMVEKPAQAGFDLFRESNRVLGRARQEHGPSLPPREAAAKLRPGEAFAIDLLLHEPLIAQPFHVSFDERGRMWVTQSRQYPYPAGLRMVSRDKYYRAQYDRVPPAPPHHDRGADIVSIHESTARDGVYDKHSVFLEGLNMANAAVRGRGGVWVMHTPYLLFYPDVDFDDVPDGPPEVRLAGFGMEDSHAIANGIIWGPDGWLYGAQGSTSSCTVVRPADDPEGKGGVYFSGCMIWRYHPDSRAFEIFSEGGGNNFGLEFDAVGRLYGGHNGPDTRGFHFVQGGMLQMQAAAVEKYGPPRHAYAFGSLPQLFSDDTIVRFTHNGAFADGTAMPPAARGHLFTLDPLHNVITDTVWTRRGSTFKTKDQDPAATSKDVAFRPVYVTNAPDGSLCVCDMYEFYVAHGQHYQNQIDPTTGRIYRLRGRDMPLEHDTNLAACSDADLVALLSHPNKWHRFTAVRLLGERRPAGVANRLRELVGSHDATTSIHALWALHQAAGPDEAVFLEALTSRHAPVRLWAVRLAGDAWGRHPGLGVGNHAARREHPGRLPEAVHAAIVAAATTEPDSEVVCQIAATARRLEPSQSVPVLDAMIRRDALADDPYIPLMVWWGIEACIPTANEAVVSMFADPVVWKAGIVVNDILVRLARRYAAEGKRDMLLMLARLIRLAPSATHAARLMEGFDEAYRGRSISSLPNELVAAIEAAGAPPLVFRLRRGDSAAISAALARVLDPAVPEAERLTLLRTVSELRLMPALPVIKKVAGIDGDDHAPATPSLRAAAIASLAAFDDPGIAARITAAMSRFDRSEKLAAFTVLGSRAAWSEGLLDAVETGGVLAADIPADVADRLRSHKDERLGARARKLLPTRPSENTQTARAIVDKVMVILADGPGNPYAGEPLFVARCSQCHMLFRKGGNVGPDLTNYQRDDLGTMLRSIVDPSAEIREGYQYHVAETSDGRALAGFIVDRDEQVTVLRTLDGETVSLAADDIDTLQPIGRSLMPSGLLDGLDDRQLRDLFAYLRIRQPISK